MKNLSLLIIGLLSIVFVNAQLKTSNTCVPFSVDLLDGNVNGIEPDYLLVQIKKKFPCFTSEEPENSTAHCGGGIFYKDKDIYFYTGRDYVEIREKFKGKLSIPIMGAARNTLYKWLGLAKIKEANWDAFQTSYGTLVLHYNKSNKVNLIQFSKLSTETLTLCE